MSGHSKWKQIKNKKGAADVKRGKLFSQISKLITVAARTGQNLDMVVARAKMANMPADNIGRAIKKGQGELGDGVQIESLIYEAYGPGGSALLITVLTDNKNRTLAEIKTILKKAGASFANAGSVQYLFDRKGLIDVASDPARSSDETELALIEAGAEDIQSDDEQLTVVVDPANLATVKPAIEAAGLSVIDAKLGHQPKLSLKLSAIDEASLIELMQAIDDHDDVETIETNANLGWGPGRSLSLEVGS